MGKGERGGGDGRLRGGARAGPVTAWQAVEQSEGEGEPKGSFAHPEEQVRENAGEGTGTKRH